MKVARYFRNFSCCRCTGDLAVAIYGIYVGTRIYIDKQIHAGMYKPILPECVRVYVCVCMTRYPLLDSAAHDIRKRRTKEIGKLMKVKACDIICCIQGNAKSITHRCTCSYRYRLKCTYRYRCIYRYCCRLRCRHKLRYRRTDTDTDALTRYKHMRCCRCNRCSCGI